MATKSIMKNISIRGNSQCRKLINAFEKAQAMRTSEKLKNVVINKAYSEMTADEMRKLFKHDSESQG